MLYITLGSGLVCIMSNMFGSYALYYALCFNRELILQGQVWRLFSYVFTYDTGSILLTAISLYCYYSLGRAMENAWGTLRFNLFYFTGLVLMDIFLMVFHGYPSIDYVSFLNLSLFLGYATLYPDAQFLFMFIIPVRAWIFGLIDLALTIYQVVRMSMGGLFPFSLFPLVAIVNYFLFFGKDVANLMPLSWRIKLQRRSQHKPKSKPTGTIPFRPAASRPEKAPYNHRCTICGRTDVSNPELEFRYCSRCSGYHCYCQEHISNHQHIE